MYKYINKTESFQTFRSVSLHSYPHQDTCTRKQKTNTGMKRNEALCKQTPRGPRARFGNNTKWMRNGTHGGLYLILSRSRSRVADLIQFVVASRYCYN